MPPDESLRAADEPHRLSGKHELEQSNTFPKRHTGERATHPDQRSPENDAREILVPKQYESQPREQRERDARDFSCLYVHGRSSVVD